MSCVCGRGAGVILCCSGSSSVSGRPCDISMVKNSNDLALFPMAAKLGFVCLGYLYGSFLYRLLWWEISNDLSLRQYHPSSPTLKGFVLSLSSSLDGTSSLCWGQKGLSFPSSLNLLFHRGSGEEGSQGNGLSCFS